MNAEIEARPDSEPELAHLGELAEIIARPFAEPDIVELGTVVTMEQLE